MPDFNQPAVVDGAEGDSPRFGSKLLPSCAKNQRLNVRWPPSSRAVGRPESKRGQRAGTRPAAGDSLGQPSPRGAYALRYSAATFRSPLASAQHASNARAVSPAIRRSGGNGGTRARGRFVAILRAGASGCPKSFAGQAEAAQRSGGAGGARPRQALEDSRVLALLSGGGHDGNPDDQTARERTHARLRGRPPSTAGRSG